MQIFEKNTTDQSSAIFAYCFVGLLGLEPRMSDYESPSITFYL